MKHKGFKAITALILILAAVMAMAVFPAGAIAETVTSGDCGDNLTWTLDDNGTLTISGTGDMWDWDDSNDLPWYFNRSDIKNVIINLGVTSIGDYAFYRCDSLTSITIPDRDCVIIGLNR